MSEQPFEDIARVLAKVDEVQGTEWNGECDCTGCYWNMYHPTKRNDSKQCVSESLAEVKMIPSSMDCPSYLSFSEFCGVEKGCTEKKEDLHNYS